MQKAVSVLGANNIRLVLEKSELAGSLKSLQAQLDDLNQHAQQAEVLLFIPCPAPTNLSMEHFAVVLLQCALAKTDAAKFDSR